MVSQSLTKLILIIVVVSYLLGSIPFGYLLVRIFRGQDVRKTGSGNIGATNVARTGSKGLAIATLLLDALKGYAAVAHCLLASESRNDFDGQLSTSVYDQLRSVSTAARFFCWRRWLPSWRSWDTCSPVWLRFKGGKGVATAAGAFLALAPRATAAGAAAFAVVVALTRYVSLGSMVAAATFPFFVWWLSPPDETRRLAPAADWRVSLLIIVRHRDNIRRLIAGTENRFR